MEKEIDPNMDLELRKKIIQELLKDKSQRVVIHLSIDEKTRKIININRNTFIVPLKYRITHFIEKMKNTLSIKSDTAIYIYKDSILLKANQLISDIYEKYKNEDNAIYLKLDIIPSFGIL